MPGVELLLVMLMLESGSCMCMCWSCFGFRFCGIADLFRFGCGFGAAIRTIKYHNPRVKTRATIITLTCTTCRFATCETYTQLRQSLASSCQCHVVLSVPRGVVSATWCCQCHVVLSVPRGVVSDTWCCSHVPAHRQNKKTIIPCSNQSGMLSRSSFEWP